MSVQLSPCSGKINQWMSRPAPAASRRVAHHAHARPTGAMQHIEVLDPGFIDHRTRRGHGRVVVGAKKGRVPTGHGPRLVVRVPTDYHTVEMLQLLIDLCSARDAAVEHDRQRRKVELEPVHPVGIARFVVSGVTISACFRCALRGGPAGRPRRRFGKHAPSCCKGRVSARVESRCCSLKRPRLKPA